MQTKQVHLAELYEVMAEKLALGGTVNFNPRGTSMLPMLHNDGDMVEIKKAEGPLKKYDLPLYRRADGAFVLHRIVRKPKDCTYTMCGDNQWVLEKGITQAQIVGVVVAFTRSGKKYSTDNAMYRLYCRVWVAIMPLRHLFIGGTRKIKSVLKRILRS